MMMFICRVLAIAATVSSIALTFDASAGEAEWKAHEDAGTAAFERGDYRGAAASLEAALNEAERFGETDQRLARTLNELARLYRVQGSYAKVEPLVRRSLAIREKALGPDHPEVATSLNNLALLYQAQGRYAEAAPIYTRSLAIREKALGPDHPGVGTTLDNLAELYRRQGRYAEAEPLYTRSLAIRERALGPDHREVAMSLNNLALLYQAQGRYAEAAPLYRRDLAISEKAFGPDHPSVGTTLNNLAGLYEDQGRYAEAEPLYRRSLKIYEKAFGPDHPAVGTTLNNLAGLYEEQGRYTKAEPLYRRDLAISEKAFGPDHPSAGTTLNNLAGLYKDQGRYAEAEPLLRRSLAIREKALGPDHPEVATTLNNLAGLYEDRGRYAEAEPLYRRSLAIKEKALGPDHPTMATARGNLAYLYWKQGRWKEGLALTRQATKSLAGRFAARGEGGRRAALTEQRTHVAYFEFHVAFLHHMQAKGVSANAEAFEVAQLARASDTAEQVAKMAVRYASGNDSFSQIARTRQDALTRLRKLDRRIVKAASLEPKKRNAEAEARLRADSKEVKAMLATLDARIEREFPQYHELTSPRPLPLADAQKLLGPGEAMLVLLVSDEESFLWVLRRDAALWERLAITRREISTLVRKLRAQLELSPGDPATILARPFDVAAAHVLYRKVIAPGEQLLAGVRHLIVVLDGALTSLPLGVLVTELPKQDLKTLKQHADVAWLTKKYAITNLPAVGSLRALRAFAKGEPARSPFLGYGDPVLQGSRDARPVAALYFRGAVADVNEVRKLARLPETAEELRAMARTLKAPEDRVRLGKEATERAVKEASLESYRILAFATHGLVAGEFRGLAEPALVLTPPAKGTEIDDGLLAASEISQLKLNADWVILSACNTAASDGTPGAEGLSGLAKAFFYAGARTLLVSHWAVNSEASAALTTRMFAEYEKGATKAEALRRSRIVLMQTPGKPHFAHPAFWAPFVIVGEGGMPVRQ